MSQYRKQSVVVEAHQLPVPPVDGTTSDAHETAVWAFLDWCKKVGFDNFTSERDGDLAIETLEGTMTASPGDWIIRGVKGEFYPCKPDIFAQTYEPTKEEQLREYVSMLRKDGWPDLARAIELHHGIVPPADEDRLL
jgi:hypothetical protein